MKASTGDANGCWLMSILRRGDWSCGKVMDAYVKWNPRGDQTVGRAVCGLPSGSVEFITLPPHFVLKTAEDRAVVCDALLKVFGAAENNLPQRFPGFRPVLIRCLAGMVYHYDWILKLKAEGTIDDSHNVFTQIELYTNAELYNSLKPLVTIKSDHLLASGIPNEVKNMVQLDKLTKLVEATRQDVHEMKDKIETMASTIVKDVQAGVVDMMKEDANSRGVISADNYHDHNEKCVERAVATTAQMMQEKQTAAFKNILSTHLTRMGMGMPAGAEVEEIPTNSHVHVDVTMEAATVVGMESYSYRSKWNFWHVPEVWRFPSITLQRAWIMWVVGQRGEKKIRPFHKLDSGKLPTRNLVKRLGEWGNLMTIFVDATISLGLELPNAGEPVTAEYLGRTYDAGISKIRATHPWLWDNTEKMNPEAKKIGTWVRWMPCKSRQAYVQGNAKRAASQRDRKRQRTPTSAV